MSDKVDDKNLEVASPANSTTVPPSTASSIIVSKPSAPRLASFAQLFHFADGTDCVLMAVGSIAAIATGVTEPIQMVLLGNMINAFTKPQDVSATVPFDRDAFQRGINRVAVQIVVLAGAVFVCGFLQIACWSITSSRQAKKVRHAYASAILRQDVGWFDTNDPMQLATRVADTTLLVQEGIGRKVGDGLYFISMGVTGLGLAFYYGWQLSLVLLAFVPLMTISSYCMTKAVTVAVQSGTKAYASAGGIAHETLTNVKVVHVLNMTKTVVTKYLAALSDTQVAGIRKGFAVGIGTGMDLFILFGTYAVAMYYGATLVTRDQLGDGRLACGPSSQCYDSGRVITAFFCVAVGASAFGRMAPSLEATTIARSAAFEVFELIHRIPSVNGSTAGVTLDVVQGSIALEDVTFAYPARPNVPIYSGNSFIIPAGQKIALVGSSGSGKSTIVSLLERFYDPLEGRVTLDGHDLKSLNVKWLRDQIGLVGQEPCLFSATIADNIRHGKPNATIEEVHEAAKQANAFEFIMGFPLGFDTPVGDRGEQLSGGQKQRIAIARAIIKNPAVLLLDEATSALDTESEAVVQASLDRLLASRQRTTIIIAHRLSTIRDADRIVVLGQGKVLEDGNHDSLLQLENGHYKALVNAQVVNDDDTHMAASSCETPPPLVLRESTTMFRVDEAAANVPTTDAAAPQVSLSRVWRMSGPEAPNLVLACACATLHGATFPIWGLLITRCLVVFNQRNATEASILADASWLSVCFAILATAALLATVGQKHQSAVVCGRLTTRLRGQCFAAMLRQDMAWFDDPKHTAGALATRLSSDSAAVRAATTESLEAVCVNVAALGVAFSLGFFYSWRVTLVFMGVIPLMGAGFAFQAKVQLANTGKDINDGDIMAGGILGEAIAGVRTVVAFNLEQTTTTQYLACLQTSAAVDRRVGWGNGIGFGVSQASMLLSTATVFYYGGWLIVHDLLDFEGMFMVFNPILFCSIGLGKAAQGMGDVNAAKGAIQRLFEILDRRPAIDSASSEGIVLTDVSGDVEFRNVHFSYPSRPDSKIYANYNLKIKSGQTVALVGGSGSGKSTAINLIERFYDPTAGSVFLDGHDLKSLNVQSLRQHISIVSQEPVLFVGTIGENIATGKPGANQEEIEDAAKKANAHDFIMQFPDKYNTAVGDRGVQVSGGQKQRIAIARAIIRDPAILLLDEATSALDNESERIVQASLDQLLKLKRRTTIIVAHRLSTVRNADVIAVVDGGRVAEQGTHDELIAIPNGIYANLVSRQMH